VVALMVKMVVLLGSEVGLAQELPVEVAQALDEIGHGFPPLRFDGPSAQ